MLTPVEQFLRYGRRISATPDLLGDIDWGKPAHVLAAEHGCSLSRVYQEFRRRFKGQRKHIRITPPKDKASWMEFKTWDWTKRDTALAKEHGYCRERVRQIRKELGMPKNSRKKVDWESVDWSLSDDEIVKRYSVSQFSVWRWRRLVGKPFPRRDIKGEAIAKLTTEDWDTLTRAELLAKLKTIEPNANKSWIADYVRKHPELKRPSKHNSAERYGSVNWKKESPSEIADRLGLIRASVLQYAKNHNLPVRKKTLTDYSTVDWSMSNKEIAVRLKLKEASVVNARLRRFKK
jgi:hypothetical protein